jgi:hypothetical protein
MRLLIGLAALAGLAACASPESMFYEVTRRSADAVNYQVNIGNMNRQSSEVADILAHMDGLATTECQNMGKQSARMTDEWTRTSGSYYTWVERAYRCS